jgi:hypothetical protein
MGFQFLNLFSGNSASVSHLAVPLHVSGRTHSRDDGGYGRVTQDITHVSTPSGTSLCLISWTISSFA